MIRFTDLAVSYGAVEALRGVSFEAKTGSVTAVIGANGAGQDDAAPDDQRPRAPKARCDRLRRDAPREACAPRTSPATASDTCPRAAASSRSSPSKRTCGSAPSTASRPCRGLEDQFDLFPVLASRRQPAGTLSGGERQMLAMARALIGQPTVAAARRAVARLRADRDGGRHEDDPSTVRSRKFTVILVEQDAMSALRVADRAVVLHLGQWRADDTSDVVRGRRRPSPLLPRASHQ